MNLRIVPVFVPLLTPFVTAWGSVDSRELLVVELTDADGLTGYGEAAPLEGYDGAALSDVRAGLSACREVLRTADAREHRSVLAECSELTVLAPALAAIDLALWDLAGRRAGQPVWRLLGGESAPGVEVNHTIGATDRAGAAAAAGIAREAGFRSVKVKVGVGDDAGRIAAVRAVAGREMAIRIDANGAWSVAEAEAVLGVLAPAGIELCEEPVSGLADFAELAAPVPVGVDETAEDPLVFDQRVADAVCLKVSRCGGITGVVDAARRARAAGYEVYLASTLDGPLGIAAALHAAAVIGPERFCGLATLSMFERPDPLAPRNGVIQAPAGAGLGDFAAWYPGLGAKASI